MEKEILKYKRKIQEIIKEKMQRVPEVKGYCRKCLSGKRWEGNVVLMVVDASFTSIGLNYFTAVVPKVFEFKEKFIDSKKIKNFEDFLNIRNEDLQKIWKNRRSWRMSKDIISYFLYLKNSKKNKRGKNNKSMGKECVT